MEREWISHLVDRRNFVALLFLSALNVIRPQSDRSDIASAALMRAASSEQQWYKAQY
jgi:hypothetical protein